MKDAKKVLACVNQSHHAEPVAEYGAWAARSLKAPLVLLHTIDRHLEHSTGSDYSGAIGIDAQENLIAKLAAEEAARTATDREQGRVLLSGLRNVALRSGITDVEVNLRHGAFDEVVSEQGPGTRLLVIGRGGQRQDARNGVSTRLEALVRTLHAPTLIVSESFTAPTSVLIAFDNGIAARHAVEMVASSALFQSTTVRLFMNGRDSEEMRTQLAWAVSVLRAGGRDAHVSLAEGDVTGNLVTALREHAVDLLVMGAYGHSALRSMVFGNRTDEILQMVRLPVLLAC